jgi:protochlorophyllide reductase
MSTTVDIEKDEMNRHWTTTDIPSLDGRLAIVTGANSGLGFMIADELAATGATVILACRNTIKANDAAQRITKRSKGAQVEVLALDLSDLSSVQAAANTFLRSNRPLDLLINNAGLMALDESTTHDGFETQFGVNHLGHFALTHDLLTALTNTAGSRIVTMSSMGHRMGHMYFDDLMFTKRYDRWKPYFQSKLANLLFTAELQRRLISSGAKTIALSAHPGASNTDLGTEGKGLTNKAMKIVPFVSQTAARGAHPALRAATDPTAQGGQFYGPRWIARGAAVVETPSKRARSETDAKRLWEISQQLTHRQF